MCARVVFQFQCSVRSCESRIGGDRVLSARAEAGGGASGRARRIRLHASPRSGGCRSRAFGSRSTGRWCQPERHLSAGHSVIFVIPSFTRHCSLGIRHSHSLHVPTAHSFRPIDDALCNGRLDIARAILTVGGPAAMPERLVSILEDFLPKSSSQFAKGTTVHLFTAHILHMII